jgi:hypothetical protein
VCFSANLHLQRLAGDRLTQYDEPIICNDL